MKDELMLGALVLGGLYIMGSIKKNGANVAENIGAEFAQGVAAGAAGAAKGAAVGVVRGVATQIPAADPETGVGDWTVPISGGYMRGSPLGILTSGNVNALWNLLPFLPDY
jgi:hypothetical protein